MSHTDLFSLVGRTALVTGDLVGRLTASRATKCDKARPRLDFYLRKSVFICVICRHSSPQQNEANHNVRSKPKTPLALSNRHFCRFHDQFF